MIEHDITVMEALQITDEPSPRNDKKYKGACNHVHNSNGHY